MTFFTLNQKDLTQAFSLINQISPRKSDVDLFTFTKIQVKPEETIIEAFNPNLVYSIVLPPSKPYTLSQEVSFLIKTDLLISSIALLNEDQIGFELNLEKNTLIVQGSKSKHTLRIETALLDQFVLPIKNPTTLNTVEVDIKSFLRANKIAKIAVGNPRTTYQNEFLNICYTLKPNSKLAVVSSDKLRLAISEISANYTSEIEEAKNILIPPKSVDLLESIAGDQENLKLQIEEDFIWIENDNQALGIRQSSGTYAPYERIIPQSFACNFTINSKDFLLALKQVYFSAKANTINKTTQIIVQPNNKKMVLSSQTSDGYSSETNIDILNYEGTMEDWSQSFNADFLLEYLSSVETENVLWESNPGKPAVLSPEGKKETEFYLVSGLR